MSCHICCRRKMLLFSTLKGTVACCTALHHAQWEFCFLMDDRCEFCSTHISLFTRPRGWTGVWRSRQNFSTFGEWPAVWVRIGSAMDLNFRSGRDSQHFSLKGFLDGCTTTAPEEDSSCYWSIYSLWRWLNSLRKILVTQDRNHQPGKNIVLLSTLGFG